MFDVTSLQRVDKNNQLTPETLQSFLENSTFYNGYARYGVKDGFGWMDSKGNLLIDEQFKSVGNFQDGFAWFLTWDNKEGYIDTYGILYFYFRGMNQFVVQQNFLKIYNGIRLFIYKKFQNK